MRMLVSHDVQLDSKRMLSHSGRGALPDSSNLQCKAEHEILEPTLDTTSSWLLCDPKLSSVSSGNHLRSDPVQVQSTASQPLLS